MAVQGTSWAGSSWMERADMLFEQHLQPSQFFLAKRALGVNATSSIYKSIIYFILA